MPKRFTEKYNLAVLRPDLAQEWDYHKNKFLVPKEITPGTGRKFWWKCRRGHSYLASPAKRISGRGCPYCSGKKANNENCLNSQFPAIAKDWHPSKNNSLKPTDFTAGSGVLIWWKCAKGHDYKTSINQRKRGSGCPICAGRIASSDYNLAVTNPTLAQEWNTSKNATLKVTDVTLGSNKKVWWICRRGHEWLASVCNRSRGAGCPACTPKTSALELRIYSELTGLFAKVESRTKIQGKECDVFIPGHKIAIEVDGLYWHRNRFKEECAKNLLLQKSGVHLIRVREAGLAPISPTDIVFKGKDHLPILKELVQSMLTSIREPGSALENKLKGYIVSNAYINNDLYNDLLARSSFALPGTSLAELNRELAVQWHPTKNAPLGPQDLTPGSNKKVWWVCEKGHEWMAMVVDRAGGRGCPYCANKKPSAEHNLWQVNRALALEWNLRKNNGLTPRMVTPHSGQRVWWRCKKGHEWQDSIHSRGNGVGCPVCRAEYLHRNKSLQAKNPGLAKEWHPTKNGAVSPLQVASVSGKKFWWKCGKEHEWEASVANRAKGRGCPFCAGKRVSDANSLASRRPQLAKEWSPKNLPLLPATVPAFSHRKVLWKCSAGHEWQATIASRSTGVGCPMCYKARVGKW